MLAELLPLAAPALPLDEAGKYVAGAYIVFVLLLVVYVGIMAAKLSRIEKELREVAAVAEERKLADGRSSGKGEAAAAGGSAEPSVPDPLTPHGGGGGGAR